MAAAARCFIPLKCSTPGCQNGEDGCPMCGMGRPKQDNRPTRGKGKAYVWLAAHLDYQGDDCLTWPFTLERGRGVHGGRGTLGYNGKNYWAHRLMCQLVHGEPPTEKHVAAHSCGKGHEGCVNPRHLSWKTPKENLLDATAHGTNPINSYGPRGSMNSEQVAYVREMRGVKTQLALSKEMGVSESTISGIWLRRYHNDNGRIAFWSDGEIATLRRMRAAGSTHKQISEALPGRTIAAVGRFIDREVKKAAMLAGSQTLEGRET